METTRHFVTTVYAVEGDAAALHHHRKLDMWLPPGGHIDRDELPHEAALRETREETGLDVDLVAPDAGIEAPGARSLPRPHHLMLEDIDVDADGRVAHQHVNHVYFGACEGRTIAPEGDDEADPDRWGWFTVDDLRSDDRFAPEVVELAVDAIETVGE